MTDTAEPIRPARLWKQLPSDRRVVAARAFWGDESAGAEQAEAMALIARQLKFRPKSVAALNVDKKAKYLIGMAQMSDPIAARLLVSYHLDTQRPMMGRFLDALGITHENGLIQEDDLQPPPAEKVTDAVRALAGEFPPLDVSMYLNTLLWQDPETWGALRGLPELSVPE